MQKLKKYIMPFVLIFVIPTIVNLMLCYMFIDHQIKEIDTAVYIGDNSQFSRSIVEYFNNSQTFNVTHYVDNPYEIEKLIRENKVKFGILIPQDFYKDIKNYKSPTILTIYDATQLASTSFGKVQAGETLLTLKGGALIKILQAKLNVPYSQAKKIVSSIGIQNRILFNPTRNYLSFLMPGFMAAMVQVGLGIAASVSINREKRRTMFTYLGSKILAYSMLGLLSLIANIYIQVKLFDVPFRGSIKELLILSSVYIATIATIGVSISAIVWDKVKATQATAMLFLPNTIMVGYTWPLIGMPKPYANIGKYIPFYHYADNLRDLMIKGYTVNIKHSIEFLIKVSLIFFILAIAVETIREKIIPKLKYKKEGDAVENI